MIRYVRLAALALLLAGGCKEIEPTGPDDTASAVDPAQSVTASVGTAKVELGYDAVASHGQLSLRLLTLDDSRCPKGVTCRAAGLMRAQLEVRQGDADPVEIELLHTLKGEPAAAAAFRHEFRLLDITPGPVYGVSFKREEYRAHIEIRGP